MNELKINCLKIYQNGKAVYNETFHDGLNIIRGHNSSGKSTIIDFIYYILGGDQSNWKEEASKCDTVLAEVTLNGTVATLKRDITGSSRQPLSVFWESIDIAEENATEGWLKFPFQRSVNKESFSQVLFRSLNIPIVAGDGNSNITLHQLLRLMYIDQISPADVLFRPEQFDSQIIREATFRTLIGAYDNTLFQDEIKLREKKKEREIAQREIKNLQLLITGSGTSLDRDEVIKKSKEIIEQIERIDVAIQSFKVEEAPTVKIKKVSETEVKLLEQKTLLREEIEKYNNLRIDIVDSENFIIELENRVNSLEDSISMRNYLGRIPLDICPSCLSPIESSDDDGICSLCKNAISESDLTSNAIRMKNEIAFQIKESQQLLLGKKERLVGSEQKISQLRTAVKRLQKRFDEEFSDIKASQVKERDDLLIRKGNLESDLQYLERDLNIISKMASLERNLENITQAIQSLELQITRKKSQQSNRYKDALSKMREYTLELLRKDLPREATFSTSTDLELDFEKGNTYSLDDRNQFSASSMVLLKNSILFSMLLASMDIVTMNYPRFLLCDNIEDKGMELDRSRNFQRIIAEYSDSKLEKCPHQIIITTSMIDPSLNIPKYCVGDEYDENNRSLKTE